MRTAELTLPGFRHDVCSAIHPGAVGSPFLRSLPLDGARPGVDPPTGAARPSVRRRHGGCARALGRGHRRRPRRGRSGVPAPVRAARRGRRRSDRPAARAARVARGTWRAAARFAASALLSRDHARQAAVRRRACAGALRRARRALDPPAHAAAQRRGRARPGPLRPRLRAGRCPAAARRRSPTRSPRTCARLGRRDRAAAAGWSRSRSCAARASSCSTSRRASSSPSPATRCPSLYRRAAGRLPLRPGRLQARPRARRADSRGRRTSAHRAATVHLGGTLAEIAAAEARGRGAGGIRSARSSCSPSRACSTPRARRRASTPSGRTATSPTARPST